MSSYLIQQMKDTETLVLTKGQLFWHYCIILFLLIAPIMTTVDVFKYYVTHTYQGVRTIGEMATWSYLPLIPAIAFYIIQKKRLKFKVICVVVDTDSFMNAAKETSKELRWEIIENNSNLVIARSAFSWRSWGELITIVKDNDRILFNSICDPDNRPSIASWGMNKVNLETFEHYLDQTSSLARGTRNIPQQSPSNSHAAVGTQ